MTQPLHASCLWTQRDVAIWNQYYIAPPQKDHVYPPAIKRGQWKITYKWRFLAGKLIYGDVSVAAWLSDFFPMPWRCPLLQSLACEMYRHIFFGGMTIHIWLVIYLSLWRIWVGMMTWPQLFLESHKNSMVPNHQPDKFQRFLMWTPRGTGWHVLTHSHLMTRSNDHFDGQESPHPFTKRTPNTKNLGSALNLGKFQTVQ